jgi:hypothetical protein
MASEVRDKLPVPGPWLRGVRAALDHLAGTAGVAPGAVTVTRVDAAGDGRLVVWLLLGGRTWRYRVHPDGSGLVAETQRP